MADKPQITLICCGLLGTLIADQGVVERSFAEAIATQGVISGTSAYARRMTQVHQARGRAAGDVLRTLFPDNEARVQAGLLAFGKSLADAIGRTQVRPFPGTGQVLGGLAATGCRLGVLTTLPRPVLHAVLAAVGWQELFDVTLSTDEVPRGCPAPDIALAAMLRVGVGDVSELAMVHSTGAGVESGRRAGAGLVAGVLTGPHSAARLTASGATHIMPSIADLPGVLASAVGPVGAGDWENAKVQPRPLEPHSR